MGWIIQHLATLCVGFVGTWLFFNWQNCRRLKVTVSAHGQMSNRPLPIGERSIISVSVTNWGHRPVNVKECYFVVNREPVHLIIDRRCTLTLCNDFPRVIEPDAQWCVSYPAEIIHGQSITDVYVEDFRGKRWYAPKEQVEKLARGIESLMSDAA